MLLTYRDIQAYDLMVDLVEKLPSHEQVLKAPVQLQYAFCTQPQEQAWGPGQGSGDLGEGTVHVHVVGCGNALPCVVCVYYVCILLYRCN